MRIPKSPKPRIANSFSIGAGALLLSLATAAAAQHDLPTAEPLDQAPRSQPPSGAEVRGAIKPRANDGERSMYESPVRDVRNSVVVDSQGTSIGYVEDIVVNQDRSEAGLVIVSAGRQDFLYVPLEQVRLEGEQFLLQDQVKPERTTEDQLRARNFSELPDSEQPVGDYIQPKQSPAQ